MLTMAWALVLIAGERGGFAGNVNHLTLGQFFVEILGKPHGPMIPKSLFTSSVCRLNHLWFPIKIINCFKA
jgi:hypothetical protein